jgi:uracil-DNA glycosylase family 4
MSNIFLPRRTNYCKGCPFEHTPEKQKHVPTQVLNTTCKNIEELEEKGVDVFFLGEAPGQAEAEDGTPLAGKNGNDLRAKIAQRAGSNSYAIGNVTRCRPLDDEGNQRFPTPEERARCFKYTLDEIHKFKPKRIVTLGGGATGAFMDGFPSMAAIRGQALPWESQKGFKSTLYPTYHPAVTDIYQRNFIPKDVRNAFEGGKRKAAWSRPFKRRTVDSFEAVQKLIKHIFKGLSPEDVVEVDVETTNGVNRINNRLLSIAFCWDGDTSYGIPLDHRKAPWTPKELSKIKHLLRRLFTKPNPSFGYWEAHNATMEIQQLYVYLGVWPRNRVWLDTMLLTFLNDENRLTLKKTKNFKPFGLKQLSSEKLGINYEDHVSPELLKGVGRGELPNYSVKDVCEYNGLDTITARRLHDKEKEEAGDYWETMMRISRYIYGPALMMFSAAEINGFRIDVDLLYELQGPNSPVLKAMKEIDTLFREDEDVIAVNKRLANKESGGMRPMFGSPWVFSLDKKQHLMKLFIERLGFEPLKYSKKTEEASLDGDYYEAYASQSPLAKKMVERQEIRKLITSYFNQILGFLEDDPECSDGRVHPSFWLNSTVTGRTSCSNPNLQQIPRAESDYSRAAKNMFTVDPGNVLVSADCTQGEVILMAQTCGDKLFADRIWRMKKIRDKYWRDPTPELKVILENECDAHRQSAAILYEVPVEKVTKQQRSEAKSVVTFGIIYGKHIKTIAADLGKTEEEAQAVQDRFFAKFKDSKKGLIRLENMATSKGYVESSIGRRRRLPQALSPDKNEANRAKRQARNSPIQSLLSDYTLFQAGRLHEYILDNGKNWRIVDVVHDAVIAEVPYAEVKEYVKVTRDIMTDIEAFAKAFEIEMIVPMLVDFDVGIAYGELYGVESWSKGEKSLKVALQKVKKQWLAKGYDVDDLDATPKAKGKDVSSKKSDNKKAA